VGVVLRRVLRRRLEDQHRRVVHLYMHILRRPSS
jgi:hypothetical protein